MNISKALPADVPGIVKVHLEAFPDFFLTMLGERFLRRFYSAVLLHPHALCFVARDGTDVVGFVVGPLEPRGFFRALLQRQGVGFVLDAIPALLRRPLYVARRLWHGATYRGEAPEMRADAALLSSIAVSPRAGGTGLGTGLVDAFCDEAANRGMRCVYLLTDRDYNPAANRFYRKAGFELDSEVERTGGRSMNRYVRELRRSEAP